MIIHKQIVILLHVEFRRGKLFYCTKHYWCLYIFWCSWKDM